MNRMFADLKMQFGNAQALYRILLINISFFLVLMLVRTIFFLFNIDAEILSVIVAKLSLPANVDQLLTQPWSLITYMFVHQEIMHILFNMLILYWTGKLLTEYLGNDKLWTTYILGGLIGGILYVLSFNLFPAFEKSGYFSNLIGASAGVIAILVAIATLLPDYTVFLFIIGAVRLKYVAMISILLYAISIPNGNAGGNIAHLGGALFGFIMIQQLRKGTDITSWLAKMGSLGKRKSRMKVVSNNSRQRGEDFERNISANNQENIDRILDKINRSGFDSLSKEEKDILYKASGKK